MNRLSTISRSLIVASFAAGALIGAGGLASATPPDRAPESGDDRASAHAGNVVAADCPELFPGSTAVAQGDIDFTGGDDTDGVDITEMPDGVEVAGVIVKGGPAYNVYPADALGDLPWEGLHAPLVPSGKPAAVSHWFVCAAEQGGGGGQTETSSPTTTTSEGEESGGGGSTESSTSDQAAGTGEDVAGEGVANAAEEQALAETGVDGGPLVALGAALLLGGGALLLLVRTRGARR